MNKHKNKWPHRLEPDFHVNGHVTLEEEKPAKIANRKWAREALFFVKRYSQTIFWYLVQQDLKEKLADLRGTVGIQIQKIEITEPFG